MARLLPAGALTAALVTLLGATATADARPRPAKCHVAAGTTVSKHGGQSLIVADVGEDDELYGSAQAVFACRSAKAKPMRLSRWEAGTSIVIRQVRWTRSYVAYGQTGTDSQCTKYSGVGSVECSYAVGGSYDLRTGKRRATYDPAANVEATVLSPQGWIGVLGRTDAAGNRTLAGADGRGLRTLATGRIDPASVRFAGADLLWTEDGVLHRIMLSAAAP